MNLAAIVLAAGAGRRFGGGKLSALFGGEPLIAHAIRAARAAPVERVIVVCPAGLDIGIWPDTPPVEALLIDSPELSMSLKAGIAAAGDCGGAFVFLGDMPLVPHDAASGLAAALGKHYAALPRHNGKNGHPVLLAARAFAALEGLTGDEGAGRLIKASADVAFLDWPDERVLLDVDRVEDLAALEKHRGA